MNAATAHQQIVTRRILAILPWFAFALVLTLALLLRWTPLGNKSYLSPLINSSSLAIGFSGVFLIWIIARIWGLRSARVSLFRGAGLFLSMLAGEGIVAFLVWFVWVFLMLGPINPG